MDIFSSLGQAPRGAPAKITRPAKKMRLGTNTSHSSVSPATTLPAITPPSGSALEQLTTLSQNNNLPPEVTLVMTNLISDYRKEVSEMREKLQQVEQTPRQQKEVVSAEYSDPDPNDESWWSEIRQEHVGMQDNGVKKLDLMPLRASLKPPNIDPSSWPWGKSLLTAEPKRAASLYLEHLQGSKRPHPATIYKAHDRSKALKAKELWSRNGAPGQEPDYTFQFTGQGTASQKSFKSERDWTKPEVSLVCKHWT